MKSAIFICCDFVRCAAGFRFATGKLAGGIHADRKQSNVLVCGILQRFYGPVGNEHCEERLHIQ